MADLPSSQQQPAGSFTPQPGVTTSPAQGYSQGIPGGYGMGAPGGQGPAPVPPGGIPGTPGGPPLPPQGGAYGGGYGFPGTVPNGAPAVTHNVGGIAPYSGPGPVPYGYYAAQTGHPLPAMPPQTPPSTPVAGGNSNYIAPGSPGWHPGANLPGGVLPPGFTPPPTMGLANIGAGGNVSPRPMPAQEGYGHMAPAAGGNVPSGLGLAMTGARPGGFANPMQHTPGQIPGIPPITPPKGMPGGGRHFGELARTNLAVNK